jgi:hypothetical protein
LLDIRKGTEMRKQGNFLEKEGIKGFYEAELGRDLGKPNHKGFVNNTLCPFHNDSNPSLSINLRTGKWLCFGACGVSGYPIDFYRKKYNVNRVKAEMALKEQYGIDSKREDIPTSLVAKYSYRDERGKISYEIRRFEPKNFQAYKKIDGKCLPGLEKELRIPYHLPEVIKAKTVYVCEGEKDSDNLKKLGFTTTAIPFGTEGWLDQYNKWFKNKNVRILPDNDEPGRKFAITVASSLYGTAKSIKIVLLPGLLEKEDVSNWIERGGDRDKLKTLVKSTEKWTPNVVTDVVRKLNKRHAAITVGGKFRIMNEFKDPVFKRPDIDFSRINDFRNWYVTKRVIDPNSYELVPVADLWLHSSERRQYEGIVFEPKGDVDRFYNLWKGLAVERKKGNWDLFRKHIQEVIADGNKDLARWILAWMARIVQDPGGERPGTALVLRGGQGVGKGVFATQFGKLFGNHFLHITNSEQITGRFNFHFKDALLVFGDEVTWGGFRKEANILKALITEETTLCEPKGENAFKVKNRVNLILASNSDWVVQAGPDERRFCVLHVSDKKKEDIPYFEDIVEQMRTGGLEAMLYDLLKMDISAFTLRIIPKTEALFEQKERSMEPLEKWWLERLREKTTIGTQSSSEVYRRESQFATFNLIQEYQTEWSEKVVTDILWVDYRFFCRDIRHGESLSKNHFVRRLRKLCPGITIGKKTVIRLPEGATSISRKANALKIPSLERCREQFQAFIGYPIWEE